MHRTISLDYNVVIEGEIEVTLDSGEVRRLKAGDIIVQRGTMHSWRNITPNEGFAGMFGVSQDSAPLQVESNSLEEDWNGRMPE